MKIKLIDEKYRLINNPTEKIINNKNDERMTIHRNLEQQMKNDMQNEVNYD